MKKRMTVALVSMKHRLGDPDFNLERHRYWVERAMERKPDFIGFPEFSLTGWVEDAGQTLPEIAAAQGVEMADLVAAVVAPRVEAIEQAVADGRLTREQADGMIAQMTEHMTWMLENFSTRAFCADAGSTTHSDSKTAIEIINNFFIPYLLIRVES